MTARNGCDAVTARADAAGLVDLGGEVLGGSPFDFAKLIAEETEKRGKVIRAAKIKPE
jgi:hypothetical protein